MFSLGVLCFVFCVCVRGGVGVGVGVGVCGCVCVFVPVRPLLFFCVENYLLCALLSLNSRHHFVRIQ